MDRRVVITAASAISPIGHTRDEILHSLQNGISGVKPLRDDGVDAVAERDSDADGR